MAAQPCGSSALLLRGPGVHSLGTSAKYSQIYDAATIIAGATSAQGVRKQSEVDTAPASVYGSHLKAVASTGGMEPLFDVCIGDSTFHALLGTRAGITLSGAWTMEAARVNRDRKKHIWEHFTLLLVGHIAPLRCAARSTGLTATGGTVFCFCQTCAKTLCLKGTF